VGRRSKLTPEVQEKIVQALAAGNYFEVACRYVGIDPRTGLEWLQRGRGEHPHREQTALYAQFAHAVMHAQAMDEVQTIARITQAGRGGALLRVRTVQRRDGSTVTTKTYSAPDPRADIWRMERKFPERWAPRVRIAVEGTLHRYALVLAEKYQLDVRALLEEAETAVREIWRGMA
jgi:hypothetical protein